MTSKDEFWGTFSIYDHRSPAYKQMLLYFDRIVVPVPNNPIFDLSEEEIDQLRAEVLFLQGEGAARLVEWDQAEFEGWRDSHDTRGIGAPEGLARRLVGDPPYQSRLMLKEETEQKLDMLRAETDALSITAVPVYPAKERFEAASDSLNGYLPEQLTLDVVLRVLPLPSPNSPFEDILRIREKESFQSSLRALREWLEDNAVPKSGEDPTTTAKRAASQLQRIADRYRDALSAARYKKVSGTITSMLAIGAVAASHADPALKILASLAAPAFSFRSALRPCWKDLEETEAFAAGVICESKSLT